MINTFIITDIAADDISEIIAYISEDSLDNARAMVDRIDAAMHKLAKWPHLGHPFEHRPSLRLWNVRPYVIIYEPIRPLEIRRVVHGARDLSTIVGAEY